MNSEKIKTIIAKAKSENRNLSVAEVKEIKELEAETETVSIAKEKADATPVKAPAKLKVVFRKSPTGTFKLAYNVGDIAKLPAALATELIEAKVAELQK